MSEPREIGSTGSFSVAIDFAGEAPIRLNVGGGFGVWASPSNARRLAHLLLRAADAVDEEKSVAGQPAWPTEPSFGDELVRDLTAAAARDIVRALDGEGRPIVTRDAELLVEDRIRLLLRSVAVGEGRATAPRVGSPVPENENAGPEREADDVELHPRRP